MSELNTRFLICEAYSQYENEGMFKADVFCALADAGLNPEKLLVMFQNGTTPPLTDDEMEYLTWAEASVGSRMEDEEFEFEDLQGSRTMPLESDPFMVVLVECGGVR
ncbi:hypothetical protein [Halodesulfovibrio sp.]|jgi:hypothetical protein|uniref:hypothetical protein n=1 Tax=Halodesulfovibrio sp. TaxID=1912772 RepID=UPI0025F7C166|nr:hypothetical protein [Halodesulfovibrio sp.]MCT4535786.1 hypothetical protein [Halodesulfovibrio sp.]